MTTSTGRPQSAELRRRAEFQATKTPLPAAQPAELSPEDLRHSLHELRVHQIELNMQHEELLKTQAALETARARYFDLYELAPVGFCHVSETGVIVEANLTLAGLLGIPRASLVAAPITQFIHRDDQDRFYLLRRQLAVSETLSATGARQSCELRLIRPDQTWLWVQLESTAATDESDQPVLRLAFSDITERRQAADALRSLMDQVVQADDSTSRRFGGTGLGLAIARRIAELMGGTLTATSTECRGSTFTATIPAAMVPQTVRFSAAAKLLAGKHVLVVDDNAVMCRITCEQLVAHGARAEQETNPALALVTIAAAAATPEPFHAIILDHHMPGMEGADFARVALSDPALANLPIILLTASSNSGDAQLMREVGIAGYLNKPVRGEVLGAVVATAIARKDRGIHELVTKHTVAPALKAIRPPTPVGQEPRVLVVEDNAVNQKIVTLMLSHLGAEVTIAHHGQEALDLIRRQTFDLVFMDCQMPVMDGYEATAAIRSREVRDRLPRLPIIAMTAHALPGDCSQGLAAGMDDHIAKPLQEQRLSEVLQEWLSDPVVRPLAGC